MTSILRRQLPLFLILCGGLSSFAQTNSAKPDLTVPPAAQLKTQIARTIGSTKPDYVVFVPEITDTEASDTGNEHFLVFDGPDGSLMAVWTQSTREGEPDQHIVFSRSTTKGKKWSKPQLIAGPAKAGDGFMASWAFPLVSKKGRIYVLYFQGVGKFDTFPHHTALLHGIYSDDLGRTWSKPENIPVPRTSRDNPDESFPPNCIVWQKPIRLTSDGRYIAGMSRWTSKAVKKNPTRSWVTHDSVVEFMRFENLDENPAVGELKISWLAWDQDAITVPLADHPQTSVCQEPSIVKLPDGRLFCVMRTMAGSPYWTMSSDEGNTWTTAKPLLRKDGGAPLAQPLSPCPIYDLGGDGAGSGRYVLFIHNHDGNVNGFNKTETIYHRRPIHAVFGRFEPQGEQPIWFEEPRFFMDHDGTVLGAPGHRGRLDLAMYSSMTLVNRQPVLWYPDRKFFLFGKKVMVPQAKTGTRR